MILIVTFFGNRDVSDAEEVRSWLDEVIGRLIAEGADTFLLGGYGRFDAIAAGAVWRAKSTHPGIRSVLVLAYPDRKVDASRYDSTTYPPIENVPRRYAIVKRNEWMADRADVAVAYALRSWGGAARALEYAKRRGKRLIMYRVHQQVNIL